MRFDEVLGQELQQHGVACTFSVPASETMRILVAAEAHGILSYRARHEQAAIGMADGYARVSGKVGVALVGRGPGLTNAANALVTASKAGSSVLVITGEGYASAAKDPRRAGGHGLSRKQVDQTGYLTALGIVSVTLNSADSALADFRAAYELAASGVTVVVLVCEDIAQAEPGTAERQASIPAIAKREAVGATAEEIEMLADLLEESWAAARPVILAGRGAARSGAKPDLLRIGDSIGALFATTLLAKPLFADHPYNMSVVGTMSSPAAAELISHSDIILSFGASLNHFTTFGGELFPNARLARIDSDPSVFRGSPKADIAIVADAAKVAAQLADELARRGTSRTGYRTPQVAEQLIADRERPLPPSAGSPGALNPRLVTSLVDRELPTDRALVIDNGSHMQYSANLLTFTDPEAFLFPSEYGSVGAGQAVALGAAVARPDRTTVLVIGDGGFMMSLPDLDTAVRYKLPLIVLILNDGAFAAEAHHLRILSMPIDVALYDNPPFDAIARASGAEGVAIARIGDIDGLGKRIAAAKGPIVIDCRVMMDPTPDYIGLTHRMHTAVPA